MKHSSRKGRKRTGRAKKSVILQILKKAFKAVKKMVRLIKEYFAQKGTVEENAFRMRKKYPLTEKGLFGEKGKGKTQGKGNKKEYKRVIQCDNQYKTAKDFYLKIGKGGKEKFLSNGHGKSKVLKDKTIIIYRKKTSTPNSPAVSLNIQKESVIKNQKIHFKKKVDEEK